MFPTNLLFHTRQNLFERLFVDGIQAYNQIKK